MDVVSSYLVVFQVSFFILHVHLDHINGQSLYETPREDQLKDSEAHSYYRKVYGKQKSSIVIIYFKHILSSLAYTVICTVQLHPMYIFWHVLKFKQSSVSKMFKHLSCAFLFCVKRGSIVLFSQVLIIWNHLLAVVVFFVQNIFMLESYDNKWKDAFFIEEHRSKVTLLTFK